MFDKNNCKTSLALVYGMAYNKYGRKRNSSGRVKVPTGGRVRDPVLFLTLADPVRFRNRQYSLDERRVV